MRSLWQTYIKLHKKGVLGMNARNVAYIARYNERHRYPLVDNKLLTKKAAMAYDITVPELYGTVKYTAELRDLGKLLQPLTGFAVKPLRGSGGKGIIIITGRDGDGFVKPSGQVLSLQDISHDINNILSGVYSLGGKPDTAIIESLIHGDPRLLKYSNEGLPDIRIVLFKGFPVMAMMRCPTRLSDGKANLHQGAVGVGLDICTGKASRATQHNKLVNRHPDTEVLFEDLQIPDWDTLLLLAAKCYDMTGLGYIGCDFAIDIEHGPMILELNARPGLGVQIANGIGLLQRLKVIEKMDHSDFHAEERVAFVLETFCTTGNFVSSETKVSEASTAG